MPRFSSLVRLIVFVALTPLCLPGHGYAGWEIEFDGACTAEGGPSTPVVYQGLVYVGSSDGAVYAFDVITGRGKWRFQTGEGLRSGARIHVLPQEATVVDSVALSRRLADQGRREGRREVVATPLIHNNTVYIGSRDHTFYALDAKTGNKKWSFHTGTDIRWEAIRYQDRVILTSGLSVYALKAETGEELWHVETSGEGATSHSSGRPVVKDHVLFFPTRLASPSYGNKSYLYALDLRSGARLWTAEVPGTSPSAPVVSEDSVYFLVGRFSPRAGESKQVLYAIDRATGQEKWSFAGEGYGRAGVPLVADRLISFATTEALFGVEAQSGGLRWRFDPEEGPTAQPLLADLLYLTAGREAYAVDPISGKTEWTKGVGPRGGLIVAPPTARLLSVIDGMIHVSFRKGSFRNGHVAVDAKTGKTLWRYETSPNSFCSGPVKYGKHLLFSTRKRSKFGSPSVPGRLYRLDAETGKLGFGQ